MVERLFLAVPRGCLRFVIVVFPDHTHLLFLVFDIISNLDGAINRGHTQTDLRKGLRQGPTNEAIT